MERLSPVRTGADATAAALRVLAWATDPDGPPPAGSLRRVGALGRPDAAGRAAVGRFAAATAARLGAGTPPLGDPGRVGCGTLLLAAAVGGRLEPARALALLDAVPAVRPRGSTGWSECVARHGVAGPAVAIPGLPGDLAEALLRSSPLTGVLHRPADGGAGPARATAVSLADRPRGTGLLLAALTGAGAGAAALAWRAELLELLRHERPAVALEVYRAARLWHGAAWDARLDWADRQLRTLGRPGELPIATVRYWAPLARLYRDERATAPADGPAVGRSVYLRAEDIGPALALVDRYRLLAQEVT